MCRGRRNPSLKKKRCSAHDAPSTFRLSSAADIRGSRTHTGRRGHASYAACRRHGSAAEHEAKATSSEDADEPALHRRVKSHSNGTLWVAARRLRHACRYCGEHALSKRSDRAGAGGFSSSHAAYSKHGHARRKSLPRYAVQLLRSEL